MIWLLGVFYFVLTLAKRNENAALKLSRQGKILPWQFCFQGDHFYFLSFAKSI